MILHRISTDHLRAHLRMLAESRADAARFDQMLREEHDAMADDLAMMLISMCNGLQEGPVYHEATQEGVDALRTESAAISAEIGAEIDQTQGWVTIFDDLGASLEYLIESGLTVIEMDQNPEHMTPDQLALSLGPTLRQCMQDMAAQAGPAYDSPQLGG